ncbi:hypothetical protein [Luteolibacter soli]|uniref:HEAT repeat domain-containing protein n=1 Tax=Luteolibacter soli TaxID=3135280 RepID=A0ABU9AX04_9BACT
MTRSIQFPAAVLSSLLLFSACEKKSESTASSTSPDKESPGTPGKSTKTERHGGTRAEREAEAKTKLREDFEAAAKITDPADREKALAAVAWDAIDTDRELAEKAFAALTPGSEESRKLVAHFAMRLADENPETALEWARNLDEGEREDAVGRVISVIAATDPTRAAALATEEVPEGPQRDRTVVQVVQRWSQKAPSEAGMWVTSLPEGGGRKGALINLARTWSQADASGFANWASTQEAKLPEMAFAVATLLRTMPDEEQRKKQLATFTDPAFRQRVEAEYKKTTLQLPPMGKPPGGLAPQK